jgi:hypothetical protein
MADRLPELGNSIHHDTSALTKKKWYTANRNLNKIIVEPLITLTGKMMS